jgi:hypothetical protein
MHGRRTRRLRFERRRANVICKNIGVEWVRASYTPMNLSTHILQLPIGQNGGDWYHPRTAQPERTWFRIASLEVFHVIHPFLSTVQSLGSHRQLPKPSRFCPMSIPASTILQKLLVPTFTSVEAGISERKPVSTFTSVSFSLGESSVCLRSSRTDVLLQL